MKIVELVEFLVKSIVKNPDLITVKQFDNDTDIIIEVLVSNEDMGVVIGKAGSMSKAIRTITQATAHKQGLKKVMINFDSF